MPRQIPPALACLALAAASAAAGQDESSPAALAQEIHRLGTVGTVLHVGAHPDDENTELITWLSRGRGYRVAYLSLTRGDGGQNEIGRDFDEKLGVARTQELLAARRLDHGRQFFTRAIDFGFSKSPEETLAFWDREQVLADVVRIYRQFRPDVVVTRFPVPPGSGGHGHHTASAMLAVEAFPLAGDPRAFPEQLAQGLQVWQPKRILWNSFRAGSAGASPLPGPVFQLDLAGRDPVTGESFGAIAARSRAMHKTQGLGGVGNRMGDGPYLQSFQLLAGEPASADLMDGINATWSRYPGGDTLDRLLARLAADFQPAEPAASAPALLDLRRRLAALPDDPVVADKRAQLDRLLLACLGLRVEATADQAEILPGEPVRLRYRITLPSGRVPVRLRAVASPGLGRTTDRADALVPGRPLEGELDGVLPADTPFTQPYWLREDGAAGISHVSDPALIGLPEDPPVVTLVHTFSIGGQEVAVTAVPTAPAGGPGDRRRPLAVIPPVSLALSSDVFLLRPGQSRPVTVEVTAARPGVAGTAGLALPAGWRCAPAAHDFRLDAAGAKAVLTFTLTAPAEPATGRLTAFVDVAGRRYSHRRVTLAYDHLPFQLLQPPARARLVAVACETRGRRVGYLPGAGDSTAEALAQLGYEVRVLAGADLVPEKLAGLDAVVIGVRAFNERSDLQANLPGLFAWVAAGGTVVAQYNRPNGLLAEPLGPYPLSLQGPAPALRVTDETAPVSFLAPDHPALNVPNRITAADFAGWIQERGAYFPSSWDQEHYAAVLAAGDPGEPALRSGLLVARHGRGYYVYTGLAFFRQLPAGVPGAYRLFANLVSLGK
ncbi:MAG: PIG-L family deacetylase [Opitutaceae bacterium]|nr:PIG-L family deacetylase [Opitutaceae bacterium]